MNVVGVGSERNIGIMTNNDFMNILALTAVESFSLVTSLLCGYHSAQ